MLPSAALPQHLLALLLLGPGAALAQTATTTGVVVIPTPMDWYGAASRCQELGKGLYTVPATPTDAVYGIIRDEPADRFWISRRRGGSCTFLFREPGGDLVAEAPCGDLMPAICRECNGDPWCP